MRCPLVMGVDMFSKMLGWYPGVLRAGQFDDIDVLCRDFTYKTDIRVFGWRNNSIESFGVQGLRYDPPCLRILGESRSFMRPLDVVLLEPCRFFPELAHAAIIPLSSTLSPLVLYHADGLLDGEYEQRHLYDRLCIEQRERYTAREFANLGSVSKAYQLTRDKIAHFTRLRAGRLKDANITFADAGQTFSFRINKFQGKSFEGELEDMLREWLPYDCCFYVKQVPTRRQHGRQWYDVYVSVLPKLT